MKYYNNKAIFLTNVLLFCLIKMFWGEPSVLVH